MSYAYDMWLDHDTENEKWLATRPVCSKCDEPIQDEYGYRLNDSLVCSRCYDDYQDESWEEFRSDFIEKISTCDGCGEKNVMGINVEGNCFCKECEYADISWLVDLAGLKRRVEERVDD